MGTGNDDHGLDPNDAANGGGAKPAGDDPAGGNPGGAADPNGGGNPPIGGADGQSADLYKPEGIADHLIGQTNQETIDKIFAENKGFRDAQAKGVPKTADEYKWNWGEKVKTAGAIAADDAMVKEFGDIAKDHGFTQKQLDAIPAFFEKMAEKGLIDGLYDPNTVLEGLAPAEFQGNAAAKQAEGAKVMGQVTSWIEQLDGTAYSDGMKTEMKLLTTSIDGMRVLQKFMSSGSNPSLSTGGDGAQKAVTAKDLERRVADPRNDAFGPQYDEQYAKETDDLFKKVYG